MKEREEILEYGLLFDDVYIDAPFHDNNWILLRYKKNKKAFAWTYERNGYICVNVKPGGGIFGEIRIKQCSQDTTRIKNTGIL